MLLRDAIDPYCATRGIFRAGTHQRLRAAVAALAATLGRPPTFGDLTADTLGYFQLDRLRRGRSRNTVRGEIYKLLALARWGQRRGLCCDVEFRPVAGQLEPPVAFLPDELKRLTAVIAAYPATIGGVPGSLFLSALVAVIWSTGERIGAVRQLAWSQISGEFVTFAATTRKGGAVGRQRRVSREAARLLDQLRQHGGAGPFSGVHSTTILNHFRRVLRLANLPDDRKHLTHALRRSHASYLTLYGGDAQHSLGHATATMTREHYLDPRITETRAACDVLPPLWRESLLRRVWRWLGWG